MTRTNISGRQIKDGSVQKKDLDTITAGQAVITKAIAGDNISLSSTGADGGTGDVTINVTGLATVATGGALDDLSDVVITSATTDQVLKYDGSNWINDAAPAAGASSLDELSDVTLTSSTSGQFLKYDGSAWINSALPEANASQSGIVTTGNQTIAGQKSFTGTVLFTNTGNTLFVGGMVHYGSSNTIRANGIVLKNASGKDGGTLQLHSDTGHPAGSEQTAGSYITLYAADNNRSMTFRSNNVDRMIIAHNGGISINSGSTPGAQLHVTALDAATKGLIVKGAASQTANVFEVQASNGGAYLNVNSKHTVFMQSTAATEKVLIVRSSSNGTSATDAHALDIQNGWGTTVAYVKPTGSAYFSTTLDSVVPLTVKGAASQTANLLEVQNSSGTALFTIDKDGSVAAGTVPAARVTGLATVATTGSYTDLSNTPTGLATETYVDTAISNLVNSAPATLDTLNELAAALGDDPNFATTIAGQIGDLDTRIDALEDNAFITREVPTGLIDGSNTIFTLANTSVAGSEQVFVNGVLQDEGASNDYTISGSTITFTEAPLNGWKIHVSYATGSYLVAPGGSGEYSISEFTHPQQTGTNKAVYTITHNLNTLTPIVSAQVNATAGDFGASASGWMNIPTFFAKNNWGEYYGHNVEIVDENSVRLVIFGIGNGSRQVKGIIKK